MNTCSSIVKRTGLVCGRKCKGNVCGYHTLQVSEDVTKEKFSDYGELLKKYNHLVINYEKTKTKLDNTVTEKNKLSHQHAEIKLQNKMIISENLKLSHTVKSQAEELEAYEYWKKEYINKYNKAYEDNKAWIAANEQQKRVMDLQGAIIEDLESKLHVNKHHKRKPTKLVRHNNHTAITTSV